MHESEYNTYIRELCEEVNNDHQQIHKVPKKKRKIIKKNIKNSPKLSLQLRSNSLTDANLSITNWFFIHIICSYHFILLSAALYSSMMCWLFTNDGNLCPFSLKHFSFPFLFVNTWDMYYEFSLSWSFILHLNKFS